LAESATTSRYHAVCTIFELWEGSAPFTCPASLAAYKLQRLGQFGEADKVKAGGDVFPWQEAWRRLEGAVNSLPLVIGEFSLPPRAFSGSLTVAEQLSEVEAGSSAG